MAVGREFWVSRARRNAGHGIASVVPERIQFLRIRARVSPPPLIVMLGLLSRPLRASALPSVIARSGGRRFAQHGAGSHNNGDPYILPHTPEHLTAGRGPAVDEPQEIDLNAPELPFPDPVPRPNESLEALRARLVYQSRKRGTLESDLLMSTFAREHMHSMTENELREFDRVSRTLF
jgi:hypothetical protein